MRKKSLLTLLFSIALIACGQDDEKSETATDGDTLANTNVLPKQLNISILWDLSDRIDTTVHPSSPQHYQRDIEIIKYFTEYFKKEMDTKGAYNSRGKIKVFFTPPPADDEINSIANDLSIDLSKYKDDGATKEKKKIYDNISTSFSEHAKKIYELTIKNNQGKKDWDGSDIWGFFKENIETCIERDTNYKNILVILTDGYIYHKDSREPKTGNRTKYILPEVLKVFRNDPQWKEKFKNGNYGLISSRNSDLNNIEILVLEVTPSDGNTNDVDYISAYLEQWFQEMGVKKSKIYSTGLSNTTINKIEAFLMSE